MDQSDDPSSDPEGWSILGYVRVYSGTLVVLTILCGFLSCLNLSLPYILKVIIDDILPGQHLNLLAYALAAVLGIIVLKNLTYYVTKLRITRLGEEIALDIRERLFHHLHQLSIGFFKDRDPGELSSRLMQDVNQVKTFVQDQMMKFQMNVLMILVSFSIMFWLHTRLAIIALVVLPLHWLVHRMYQRSIKKHAREAQNTIGSVTGDVVEQFSGVQEVKSSSAEEDEERRFKSTIREGMTAKMEETKQYLRQKIFADGLVGFGQLLVIAFATYEIINGSMKVGTFIAFYGYTGMLYPKTLKLISQAGKFSSTAASLDRIAEIMNREPEIRVKPSALPREIREGKVEFRNVSFSYDHEQIFENLNFTAYPGDNVLVTGVSGSGKSTLLNLIPRFYELDGGQILIDDVDVREYTLTSLREQIGIVFQDCFLFGSSIRENIQYAKPDATNEEILEACEKAEAHEFISHLPNGYRTVIGEGGVHLSGGEKQRLVIARTILKDPAILILDEALTTLDKESRTSVARNLRDLMEDRTMFTVTHDPSVFSQIHREIHLDKKTNKETAVSV
jgi:subfamily B ATP-binding cassette protein MsbA